MVHFSFFCRETGVSPPVSRDSTVSGLGGTTSSTEREDAVTPRPGRRAAGNSQLALEGTEGRRHEGGGEATDN